MIVFKKLNAKRINPFKVLDDEPEAPAKDDESLEEIERSDWKQKLENKKRTSDGELFNSGIDDSVDDVEPIRKNRCRYGRFKNNICRNSLSENKISSDEKEFDKLSIPVKRKVSSDSDNSMADSDYSPVVLTKIRRFSKDEDSTIESDEIDNSSTLFQGEDSEVESSDVRSSSIEGGYSQDVNNTNKNNLNSGEKKSCDGDRHLLSQIPPTEKKKWPQKPCIICRRHGVRHDTRYYCKFCNAALCKEPCFREYHSM